ncbi:MAG: hypothetical protein V7K77_14755 [Nostoc sp.]|uniref:beta strand repeat-containing protein n=1 Tax=Nostoc sp. TaxID=1180 RepID=UPI002FF5743A
MSIFTVTNTKNSGAGSLRQAILDANTLTGKDIINFSGLFTDGLAHTISLTGSGLSITDDLTIQGRCPSLLTIKDDSADRVFDISKDVTSAINGLTITNSYKNVGGGGAISNEGVLTLSNSIITGNTAKGDTRNINGGYLLGQGGGIYNTGSLTVNNSTITGNTAEHGGGGIESTGSLTVNHSIITDNTASDGGGGIESSYINATITTTVNNSTIANNTVSTGVGGGIYNAGSLTVNHSTITDNTASSGNGGNGDYYGSGGGIYNAGSLTVNHSTITDNTASSSGGGIGSGYGNATITTVNYSIISGNTADNGNGGGIYIHISSDGTLTLSVSNSSISDNSATFSGGGIYIGGYISPINITVSNSIISGNSALQGGGGIYDGIRGNGIYDTTGAIIDLPSLTPRAITISNSIISGNSALKGSGGGICNYSQEDSGSNSTSSTITVSNSIISGNTAEYGGGIYNLGIITLNNSSVSDNTALEGGGGIYNGGFTYPGYRSPDTVAYGNLTAIASTISDNSASTGGGIYNNGTLSLSYSTISDNDAKDYGGGIYNSSFNEFGISYPSFNESSRYNTLGIVTVSYSSIRDNTAGTAGGGIYNDADQDFGKVVEFTKGTALTANITYDGLGIVKVGHSSITGNQAHFGGGIYNNASLMVGNSIIRHNKAFGIELSSSAEESGKGGGIYNSNSKSESATVNYSIIACNFDTQQKDSNKPIKPDDVVGKFITKGDRNWIGKHGSS